VKLRRILATPSETLSTLAHRGKLKANALFVCRSGRIYLDETKALAEKRLHSPELPRDVTRQTQREFHAGVIRARRAARE
jgi:hypothetical protein